MGARHQELTIALEKLGGGESTELAATHVNGPAAGTSSPRGRRPPSGPGSPGVALVLLRAGAQRPWRHLEDPGHLLREGESRGP